MHNILLSIVEKIAFKRISFYFAGEMLFFSANMVAARNQIGGSFHILYPFYDFGERIYCSLMVTWDDFDGYLKNIIKYLYSSAILWLRMDICNIGIGSM